MSDTSTGNPSYQEYMKLRRLGASELMVSPLGLGCWQFSRGAGFGGRYWPALPDDVMRDIVKNSLDGGVNWFDTAEVYGWGESERVLSATLSALGKKGQDVIVATKWWPALRSAGSLIATIDRRLECLGGFPISLHQVHQPFGISSVEKEMDAMVRLVESKRIRYVGVSNFNAARMRRADARLREHGLRLISNQVRYNLLHRSIEFNGVLEAAKELGISIIAYSPLAQGVLSGKFHDMSHGMRHPFGYRRYLPDFTRHMLRKTLPLIETLKSVAGRYGATPSQVALQWTVAFHGENVVTIPGSTSAAQAKEDVESKNLVLTRDELHEIDEASKRLTK